VIKHVEFLTTARHATARHATARHDETCLDETCIGSFDEFKIVKSAGLLIRHGCKTAIMLAFLGFLIHKFERYSLNSINNEQIV
jgi:hypothetical protein